MPRTVYHAYNRERDRAPMFRDAGDRRHFKALFARYLAREVQRDERGRDYPNHRKGVRLLALTLKTNHFHVVLLQIETGAAGELMHAVMTSYVKYFNGKYGRGGALFDSEVKMRPARDRRDELNVVAYVHENHGDHCYCEFCSHSSYLGHPALVPEWMDVAGGLALFGGVAPYLDWLRARQIQRAVIRRTAVDGGA